MLRERLASLATRCAEYQEDGLELNPLGVAAVTSLLQDMADDAAILERNSRPLEGGTAPYKIPEGSNIVRLETGR